MMIKSFQDANMLIADAYADERGNLDPTLAEALNRELATQSGPDRVWKFVEIVYARRGEVSEATKLKAADVSDWATLNGWGRFEVDDRGALIAAILREEPIAGDEPAALERYLPPEPDATT